MTKPVQNDLDAIARLRVSQQYKESTRLLDTLSLFIAELTEIQTEIFRMMATWNLDDATGWGLDVIGRIVGLDRPRVDATIFGYFGYAGAGAPLSYGDEDLPEVGGRYLSINSFDVGSVLMEDEDYRIHIRAKILKNQTSAKPEEVIEIIHTIFPDVPWAELHPQGLASASITFGRLLSSIEIGLVTGTDLLPRPAGVSIAYAHATGVPFGYAGSPGSAYGAGAYASLL